MTRQRTFLLPAVSVLALLVPAAVTADWAQFRGPHSAGVSDATGLPVTWSDEENLQWRAALPGPGASSPVLVGDKVYVTAYSGYGAEADAPGEQEALGLHVLCFDLEDGDRVWQRGLEPRLPVEDYERFLPEHGYASSTPASDGDALYAFFGRSGVHAFDLEDGEPLWSASAGDGTHGFGTANSPLLHGDLVVINACVESDSVIAFDKATGEEVWRTSGIERSWSTPVLVETPEGDHEVVVSMQDAVLGLDPRSGQKLWTCEGIDDYVCPTPVSHDGVVYAFGGRKEIKSLAVRAGGRGDVTGSRRLWKSSDGSKVPSPVYHDGHLYWVQHTGIAYCAEADTGEVVYKSRLEGIGARNKTYASAVLAEGRLYVVTCYSGTFVLEAKPEFHQIAHNTLSDESTFNASPAVAEGRLVLRSNRFLYCLGEEGSTGGSPAGSE